MGRRYTQTETGAAMTILRAYLRASTADQDATRAAEALDTFAAEHGHRVDVRYIEHASGATTDRPELRRLLTDAHPGDVILVESIDRLARLPQNDWDALRADIEGRGLRVVAVDLPTSHTALTAGDGDDFTGRMLDAVNRMMLDVAAAVARKDYEQRRQRQREGIERARREGRYQGRPKDEAKRERIAELLAAGFSVRKTAKLADASTSTVYHVKAATEAEGITEAR